MWPKKRDPVGCPFPWAIPLASRDLRKQCSVVIDSSGFDPSFRAFTDDCLCSDLNINAHKNTTADPLMVFLSRNTGPKVLQAKLHSRATSHIMSFYILVLMHDF